MKRIFLFLALPLIGGALVAQPALKTLPIDNTKEAGLQRSIEVLPGEVTTQFNNQVNPQSNRSLRSEPHWSDDFSDPSTWITTDQSTDPYGWVFGSNPYTASITGGTGFTEFESETADNGYAFINSDGSPFTSDGGGQIIAQIRTANSIDCSELDFVWLTFQHNYRWWQDTRGVRVSGDNGVTWTEYEITGTTAPTPQSSENPEFAQINVTEAAAGMSDVLIEFYYNDNNFWAWYWAVDDVALSPPADNDLVIDDAYRGFWPVAFDDAVDAIPGEVTLALFAEAVDDVAMVKGYEYGFIPADQGNIHFVGYVLNNGFNDQTGVTLTAFVTDPEGIVHTFESPEGVSIESQTLVRIDFEVDLAAEFDGTLPNGLYTVSYEVGGDQEEDNPVDNTAVGKSFRVNNNQLGHDTGVNQATSYYIDPHNAIFANRLAFQEPATITHLSFAVSPNRNLYPDTALALTNMVGELVFPNIRRSSVMKAATGSNPASPIYGDTDLEYIIETDEITLTGADVIMINFALPEPEEVELDQVYQVEVRYPQLGLGAEPWVWVPTTSGANRFSAMLRDFAPDATSSYGQGWFELGANPMFRFIVEGEPVSTSPFVGKLDFHMGQNYPNPVNGHTSIDWSLEKPMQNIRFSVTDNTGRTVHTIDLGDRPAGPQNPIMLDMSRFAAGVYQYGITIGNERIVRKMMIAK